MNLKDTTTENLNLGLDSSEIKEFVYGGKDLADELYTDIEIRAEEQQLRKVKADIILTSKKEGLGNIEIKNVSMKQFLIIGLTL